MKNNNPQYNILYIYEVKCIYIWRLKRFSKGDEKKKKNKPTNKQTNKQKAREREREREKRDSEIIIK